jgi:hypothetical protein
MHRSFITFVRVFYRNALGKRRHHALHKDAFLLFSEACIKKRADRHITSNLPLNASPPQGNLIPSIRSQRLIHHILELYTRASDRT